jgi:hypothetical protein
MSTPPPDPFDVSSWPTPPRRPDRDQRPKRPYKLSLAGLDALRAAARRTKPWTRSTGPTTPAGKERTRLNGLKHGRRSAAAVERRRLSTAGFKKANAILAAHEEMDVLVLTLHRLSKLLAIDFDELAALVEHNDAKRFNDGIVAAANRRGVDLAALDRWLHRAAKTRTLDGFCRLKAPTPKPPPIRIELRDPSEW